MMKTLILVTLGGISTSRMAPYFTLKRFYLGKAGIIDFTIMSFAELKIPNKTHLAQLRRR